MVDQQVTIRLEAEDQLTPTLRSSAREAMSLAGALDRAGRTQGGVFGAAATRAAGGLRSMQAAMRDTTGSATRLERAVTVAGRASTVAFRGVDKGLRPLAARMDEAAAAAQRVTDRYERMERAGRGMLIAGGAMAAGVGLVAKKYAEFDKAMSGVAANTGATGAALDSLRAKAIELGGATQFSGKEAADGINELAKAGVSTADILNGGLKGALSLAAAGQMEVGEAAETAASAMTQFGLSGQDIPHIADLLAAGANKAQGSVHDMSMALNQAGLVAHATGLNIDETVATLTAFASAGMTGSDAGTSLKTMLQRLAPQSEEASKTMEALGISAYDANGQFVGMTEFAGNLQRSMAGLSPEARSAAMNIIFGADAVRAANIVFQQGSAGMEAWRKQILLAGFAARNASILTDNLSGDMERFGGAVDEVVLKSGGSINDLLREVVQAGTAIVDALGDIPAPILKVALGLGAAATAATLVGGAVLTIAPKALAAKAALGQLGVTATGTATALSMLGKATAVVGVAMLADDVTGYISDISMAKPPTDQLAASLVNLSKDGQQVSSLLDLYTPKFDIFGQGAKTAGEALQRFGHDAKIALDPGIWHLGPDQSWAMGDLNAAVKQVDASLAQLVKSGRIDEATTAYQKFIDAAKQQGVDGKAMDELVKKFELFNQAIQESTDTTSKLTVEQQRAEAAALGMSDAQYRQASAAEKAQKATQSFHDAIQALGNVMLAQRDAERGFEAAIDDASAALARNGKTLDITTAKGRENQAALDGIASAGVKAAAEIYNQTGSLDAVNVKIGQTREQFIKAAVAFGMGAPEAKATADALSLTTEQVQRLAATLPSASGAIDIDVNAQGLIDAQRGVQTLHDKLGVPLPAVKAPVMGGFLQAMATGLGAAERLNASDPRVDVTQKGAQGVQGALQDTTAAAKKTDAQNPNVSVSQNGAQGVQGQLTDTTGRAQTLDRQNPNVKVTADTSSANSSLDNLLEKIRRIASERWNAFTGWTRRITPGVTEANGGVLDYYAQGGIRRERHVAQIAPAGAWRVWAEEETGGEAYIPLARSKRARSMAILEEVASRFGASVVAQAQGSMLSSRAYVAPTGVKAAGAKLDLRTGKIVVPVTAQVVKVVMPRGMVAPFTATAGGPWDRSVERPAMDVARVSRLFNDRYVSAAELKEAAEKYFETRTRYDEAVGTSAAKAGRAAATAAKALDAARARVSAAEAALERLNKRKGVTAKERQAARDKVTAARNAYALAQRQAREARVPTSSSTGGRALSQAPKSIATLIRRYAGQYKVDPDLVAAVIKQESGFNVRARSRVGAQGLMQLMPGTARALGVRNAFDPAQNIAGGVKYLAQLLKQFSGDVKKALAAYNAGPSRAKSSRPLPTETQRYVRAVTANLDVASSTASGVGINFAAGRTVRAVGANAVKASKVRPSARAARAAATTTNPLVEQMIANAKRLVGRYYRWGGGHGGNNATKNLDKALVDCSGLINVALSHVLRKNVDRVAANWTSGKGLRRMSIQEALNTPGAFLGNNHHVVMSLGGGRVIEAPQTGKKVRERRASAREFSRAAWYTALGTPTKGAYTPGGSSGGGAGAPDAKTIREAAKAQAAAKKAYEDALKAYRAPAYVHLAAATRDANTYSRAFLRNIRTIRDRGYPSLAYRLLEMGDEDGAVAAASLVKAPDKVLRQQRNLFEENAANAAAQKKITEELSKTAGPAAHITAIRERTSSNAAWKKFLDDVDTIRKRGYPTLAAEILGMGVDEGGDVAATAARAADKDLRQLRDSTTSTPEALKKRQDDMAATMLGPRWRQDMTSTAKSTAASATFLANIRAIRDKGFPGLALRLMEMGEDDAGAMAAEAAKATATDLTGWDKTHEASKAMSEQTQRLLDELRGVGKTLNVTVGLATGGEPTVTYTAPRAVDARPASPQYIAAAHAPAGGSAGPLLHVENMYAASPSQAATQLETRLGDAVAVSGIGRVI